MVFTGFYRGVGFEFNGYVNGRGRLNRKTRQNPVWHKPVTPPDTLRQEIDKVIRWMKSIDGTVNVTVPRGPPLGLRSSMTDPPFHCDRDIRE